MAINQADPSRTVHQEAFITPWRKMSREVGHSYHSKVLMVETASKHRIHFCHVWVNVCERETGPKSELTIDAKADRETPSTFLNMYDQD
jgi:hypothetical protein